MFRNLSYHYKIPLTLSVVIMVTALVVSATLIARAYQDTKDELIGNAISLGKVLAQTLRPSMLHDEVWQAYEVVATASEKSSVNDRSERVIVVLDRVGKIYVATQPARFPTLEPLSVVGPEYAKLQKRIAEYGATDPLVDDSDSEYFHMIVPILAEDGARLGTLILEYSRFLMLPRFYKAIEGVILSAAAVLLVLLPLGWYLGKRMALPLEYLAESMTKVGHEPAETIRQGLYKGADEIGTLSAKFSQLLKELEDKKAMARQMFASERLAAIGRLTSGIAHEINNPLGGMLNAINTFKRHGNPDSQNAKTFSLLERGLLQIKETVGALLVEARLESHALTPEDIEDTRTLISPNAERKAANLVWENQISEPLPLPSTQVRQILLNLLLNAVHAVEKNGKLECCIERVNGSLRLSVANDGKQIAPDQMEHLYEPFAAQVDDGNGLGLWVTYQIVQQLRGAIEAKSDTRGTRFTVTLPLSA